jgi:hypothetical protein
MEQLNAFIEMPGNTISAQNIGLYAVILASFVKGPDVVDTILTAEERWSDKLAPIYGKNPNNWNNGLDEALSPACWG